MKTVSIKAISDEQHSPCKRCKKINMERSICMLDCPFEKELNDYQDRCASELMQNKEDERVPNRVDMK